MKNYKFLKGFEVELFTGTLDNHVGVSNEIEEHFKNFVKEAKATALSAESNNSRLIKIGSSVKISDQLSI